MSDKLEMMLAKMQEQMDRLEAQNEKLAKENEELVKAANKPKFDASFNLLQSKSKKTQYHPDMFGRVKVEGVWFQVAAWDNNSGSLVVMGVGLVELG